MPLPEDEGSWGELDVMFATTRGTVRRNKLSDFVQVNRNGKIAMKLEEEGDEILGVETCSENADVLLTAELGPVHTLFGRRRACLRRKELGRRARHRHGRGRPRHLDDDTWSISTRTPGSARPISSASVAERKAAGADEEDIALTNEEVAEVADLSDERYDFLRAHEQFVLTVTEYGYGKRSSSYDFRLTGRGGKGIRATDVSKAAEIGRLVATFPVGDERPDHAGLRRRPGDPRAGGGIRIASRATKGVTIFNTAEGEKVVSVERISEPEGEEEDNGTPAGPDEGPGEPS